jgi:hypothetical protein
MNDREYSFLDRLTEGTVLWQFCGSDPVRIGEIRPALLVDYGEIRSIIHGSYCNWGSVAR